MQEFENATKLLKGVNNVEDSAIFESDKERDLLFVLCMNFVCINNVNFKIWDNLSILLELICSHDVFGLLFNWHMKMFGMESFKLSRTKFKVNALNYTF